MTVHDRFWLRVQEGDLDLEQALDLLAEYYEAKGDVAREDSVIEDKHNEDQDHTHT